MHAARVCILAAIKRVEKLHHTGQNHVAIPALRQAPVLHPLAFILHNNIGVVLEDAVISIERRANVARVLVEDGVEWNDIEDARHTVTRGVPEGKA